MANNSKKYLPKEEYWTEALKMKKAVEKLAKEFAVDVEDSEKYFDIHGVSTKNLNILYLPSGKQGLLDRYRDNRIRLYKICNYDKPAAKITFSLKHQYSTQTVDEKILQGWILDRESRLSEMKKIREKGEEQGMALIGEEDLEFSLEIEIKSLIEIADNFSQYEIVQSSFLKNYTYTMMNYRHATGRGGALKSSSSQLVVPKEIKLPLENEPIHIKTNIVFLDMERIMKPSYNKNRKVWDYLSSFELTFVGSTRDLFVKKIK